MMLISARFWLPPVAELPGYDETVAATIAVASIDDAEWVDEFLVGRLRAETTNGYVFVTSRMGEYTSASVVETLLAFYKSARTAGNFDEGIRAAL